jgi:hypothetical protein
MFEWVSVERTMRELESRVGGLELRHWHCSCPGSGVMDAPHHVPNKRQVLAQGGQENSENEQRPRQTM